MNASSVLAVLFGTALPVACISAERPAEPASLRDTLHQFDAQLFDAFNHCADPAQLKRHAAFFAPDTEFYHDTGGVTWTRKAMIDNTRKNACGHYTRELVESSFNVSPIKGFGAITTGVHRFCQTNGSTCEGEADFVMVWRHRNGKWEVTRTMSYGHRPAPSATQSTQP